MGKINVRPGTLLRWHALKRVLESEIKEGSTIFDIGGYDGFISYNLKKLFPKLNITTIDIEKTGLQEATERGLNALYASALELLIREISRVLKKGGKVILSTPMQNGISFPLISKEKSKIINKNWGHVRMGYDLKELEILFKNDDLAIEKTSKYFNLFTKLAYLFLLSSYPILNRVGRLLYGLTIKLEPYIRYKAEGHIIIGKK